MVFKNDYSNLCAVPGGFDYKVWTVSDLRLRGGIYPRNLDDMKQILEVGRMAPFGAADINSYMDGQGWYRILDRLQRWNKEVEYEPFVCVKQWMNGHEYLDAVYAYSRNLEGKVNLMAYTIAWAMKPEPNYWERHYVAPPKKPKKIPMK